MSTSNIRNYANSFLAFAADVPIRVGGELRRFAEVATPFQLTWLSTVAPSAEAVAKGKQPPIGRVWCEATKGNGKSSLNAILVLWLMAFSRRALRIQIAAADQAQAAEVREAAAGVKRALPWLDERVRI